MVQLSLRPREGIIESLRSHSKSVTIAVSYFLVLLFGFLDYLSGPTVSLSILYVIPIILGTWNLGRANGIALAATSAAVWLAADMMWLVTYAHAAVPYWNAIMRFGVFLVLVLLVWQVRTANERLHQSVAEKTANLTAELAERKRVEEELRKSEGQFRAIFDNTSDGMFLVDLKTRKFFMCNATCATMLGYTQEQFLNRGITDIHPEEDLPFIYEQIGEFSRGEHGVRSDIRFKRKDGSIFVADLSPAILAIAEKEYLVVSFRDITERKRVEEKLRKSYEQLHQFAVHLQSAREEERSEIAREIHDELGQALTGLKFDISWIGKKLPKGTEELQDKTRSIAGVIDGTIQMVRRISSELRPGVLDRLGLVAAIEWQVQEFHNRTGINCTLSPTFEGLNVDGDRSLAIFRILQEALTNVARHANATAVDISLSLDSRNLMLEVRDNGEGISESAVLDPKSLGLLGMKERALAFGGRVNVVGNPGSGTRVILAIPCAPAENKGETS
jgi:PAS domain S-box-containing protein